MALPYALWVLGSAIVRAATPRIAQMLAKQGFKKASQSAAKKIMKNQKPPVVTKINQIKKIVDKAKVTKPKTTTKVNQKPTTKAKPNQKTTQKKTKPKGNQQKKKPADKKEGKLKKTAKFIGKSTVAGLAGKEVLDMIMGDDKPKKEDVKVISKTDKKTDKKVSSASDKKTYQKGTGAVKVPGLTKEFIARAKRFDDKKEKITSKKDYKPVYDKAQAEKRKKLTENIVSPKGVKSTNITAGGNTGFGPKGNIFASNEEERKRLMDKYGGTGSAAAKAAAKGTQGNLKKKKVKMGGYMTKTKTGHKDYRKGGLFYG